MSMLSNGIASFLIPALKAGAGIAATYTRGNVNLSITVIDQGCNRGREYATRLGDSPDSTDYVIFTPEIGYRGFSVVVTDLATLTPMVPQRGDNITIGAQVFPLLAIENAESWRWESSGLMFRLHTKLMS